MKQYFAFAEKLHSKANVSIFNYDSNYMYLILSKLATSLKGNHIFNKITITLLPFYVLYA